MLHVTVEASSAQGSEISASSVRLLIDMSTLSWIAPSVQVRSTRIEGSTTVIELTADITSSLELGAATLRVCVSDASGTFGCGTLPVQVIR